MFPIVLIWYLFVKWFQAKKTEIFLSFYLVIIKFYENTELIVSNVNSSESIKVSNDAACNSANCFN